jgi:Xaa-Pro aminopeptidase
LYIAEGTKGVEPRWWNIGIRIEDDVCVTRSGHEVLSIDAPKAIDEIEALMRER